jgi:His-Xaa-Ser system protein HxsD
VSPPDDPGQLPIVSARGDGFITVDLDVSIYPINAIFRSCYKFTDRCSISLTQVAVPVDSIRVFLRAKSPAEDLDLLAGDLANELIDQQIRETLALEAGTLRALIAAQAFAEGNLLDEQRDEGDYSGDPLGIGTRH